MAGDVFTELRKVQPAFPHDCIGSGWQMREFPDADEPGLARGQGRNKVGGGNFLLNPGGMTSTV